VRDCEIERLRERKRESERERKGGKRVSEGEKE